MTHHLVHGVVATDVLAHHHHSTRRVEGGSGVHRPGGVKQGLKGAHRVHHCQQHRRVDGHGVGEGAETCGQVVNGGGPAHPARRRRGAQPRLGSRGHGPGVHHHGVWIHTWCRPPAARFRWRCPHTAAMSTVQHLGAAQQPFGEAPSGGQFGVVARGAHGGGHQHTIKQDRQRLLHDQFIGGISDDTITPALGQHPGCGVSRHDANLPPDATRPRGGGPPGSWSIRASRCDDSTNQ